MTLQALVTRPEADAAPVAEALRARGLAVAVEPLLTVRPLPDAPLEADGVQALLFTSANGVRALSAHSVAAQSVSRDLPVFAVGDATAEAVRAAGFAQVESAAGDVNDLARLVRDRLDPAAGPLLHVAGSVTAGDLAGDLGQSGFELRRAVLYEADPVDRLSPETAAALADGAFDFVLFFSPRTARSFVELVSRPSESDADPAAGCGKAEALCLSAAVAEAAAALPWRRIRTADRPDLPSMLKLVDVAMAAKDGTAAEEATPGNDGRDVLRAVRLSDEDRPEPAADALTEATVTDPTVTGPTVDAPTITAQSKGEAPDREAPEREAPDGAEPNGEESNGEDSKTEEPGTTAPWTPTSDRLSAPGSAPASESGPWAGPGGPAPLPPRRGLAGLAALAALVAALVAVAAVLTQPWWGPGLGLHASSQEAEAGRLAEAEQRLSALDGRLDRIDDTLAGLGAQLSELGDGLAAMRAAGSDAAAPKLPPEIGALPTRLDGLEQQIGDLAAALQQPPPPAPQTIGALEDLRAQTEQLRAGLSEVRAQLDAAPQLRAQIEAQEATAARHAENAAIMLAAGQLRAALASDAPFAEDLEALRDIAGDRPGFAETIEPLAAQAETGIPTLAGLRASFPETARAITQAGQSQGLSESLGTDPDSQDWIDSTIARLSTLVTVRPIGDSVEGDGPAARVARAEVRLETGDLEAAVAELSALTGEPAEAAAQWLGQARMRLAADAAAAKLQTSLVRALARRVEAPRTEAPRTEAPRADAPDAVPEAPPGSTPTPPAQAVPAPTPEAGGDAS